MVDGLKITDELIERLKAQDERWQAIDTWITVEAELRDSLALNLIIQAAHDAAEDAINRLCDVAIADTTSIIKLQAHIYCAKFIVNTLDTIRQRGVAAQQSLQEEGDIREE